MLERIEDIARRFSAISSDSQSRVLLSVLIAVEHVAPFASLVVCDAMEQTLDVAEERCNELRKTA